jgi:hypothetical protein
MMTCHAPPRLLALRVVVAGGAVVTCDHPPSHAVMLDVATLELLLLLLLQCLSQ